MPLRAVLAVCVCVRLCHSAAAADHFPFQATIASDAVKVHSGPGERFYATGKLHRGDSVEIYRLDAGDWYAIRPPWGRFSWVPAEQVTVLEGDVAEATAADVTVQVGSSMEADRNVSHVKLRRGERVVVLSDDGEASAAWIRIAPPSGEFRWIHASHIAGGERQTNVPPSEPGASRPSSPSGKSADSAEQVWRTSPQDSLNSQETAYRDARIDRRQFVQGDIPTEPADAEHGWVRPRSAPRGHAIIEAASSASATRTQRSLAPLAPVQPSDRTASQTTTSPPPPSRTAASLDRQLDGINLDLSAMVVGPREQWSFTELRNRAKTAMREADDAADRARARKLLERIAQFDDVRNKAEGGSEPFTLDSTREDRRDSPPPRQASAKRVEPVERTPTALNDRTLRDSERSVLRSSAPDVSANGQPAKTAKAWFRRWQSVRSNTTTRVPPPERRARNVREMADRRPIAERSRADDRQDREPEAFTLTDDVRYDGTGKLVPLEKRGAGDPQYTLEGPRGETRCYVTAAPGVNLRRYRDRLVGVTGIRADDPALRKPHIMAQHVSKLPSDASARK